MSRTPSISRASSMAPSASQLGWLPPRATPSASGINAAASASSSTTTHSFQHSDDEYDVPGCEHLEAIEPQQLGHLLKRYSVGLRWGKRVRKGHFYKPEEEEDEEDPYDEVSYYHHHEQQQKRKKLLDYPSCSSCYQVLSRPYICLDCAFCGCMSDHRRRRPVADSCMARHLAAEGHAFAFDIHAGIIFCSACQTRVSDSRFDLVYHHEKGRASRSRLKAAANGDLNAANDTTSDAVSSRAPRGIHNLGATCFLSVILQSFLHNPILRNYFLSDRHNAELCPSSSSEPCIACEMDKMFREFFLHDREKNIATIDPWIPNSFLYCIWRVQEASELAHAGQQDSHEFFISTLNALHSALTAPGRDPDTRQDAVPKWENENETGSVTGPEQGPFSHPHYGQGGNFESDGGASGEHPPQYVSRLCDCIIHRAFSGVLQSDVRCLICGYQSSTHDPVLDLSVDIRPPSLIAQQHRETHALIDLDGSSFVDGEGSKKKKKKDKDGSAAATWKKDKSSKLGKSTSSSSLLNGLANGSHKGKNSPHPFGNGFGDGEAQDLLDCLRRYCTSEKLPPSSYSCPQCGPVEASKQLSLCRLPPILCIQLKRFEHTATSTYKIETKIRFPLKLDVREFVTPCVLEKGDASSDRHSNTHGHGHGYGHGSSMPSIEESFAIDDFVYNLFCVIVHEGTLNTGHYWCFCKWQDVWYRLNDTDARPVHGVDEVFENAYQLVYVRDTLENVLG